MPATKSALLRYRIIDKCLTNKYKPYPTKEELRQACEDALFNSVNDRVSISTIEKDLNAMRFDLTLGYEAPIAYSKEYKGYYYEDPNYSIDAIPLNEEDLQALRFAAQTLHQFKGIKIFEEFDFAIGKIFDRISLGDQFDQNQVQQYVQFESAQAAQGNEWLPVLLEAAKEKRSVEVKYEPFSKKPKSYVLHPYLLKEYRNRWYLLAWDEKADKIKTFGLERVSNVELTQAKFTRNSAFNPEHFFNYSIGITASNEKPKKVQLQFDAVQKPYVLTQPLHHSQTIISDTKKELIVELEVIESIELVMTILGFGKSVHVLSPKSLIKKVKKELRKAVKGYD